MPYKNYQKRLQHNRKYYIENKEKISQWGKKYYQKNRERILQRCKRYNQEHKKERLAYKRNWENNRRKIDPKYRLDRNIGTDIRHALRSKKAGQRWETLVGYTIKDLIKHLERLFNEKMGWTNYGSYWVIDHKKPRSLFRELELKQCWALDNLQPLEKIINLKKGKRYKQ